MTDLDALEAVLAKARSHIMNELWPLLGGNHTAAEDWATISDAITAGMSIDLPALIAEHRAALATVEALEGALTTARRLLLKTCVESNLDWDNIRSEPVAALKRVHTLAVAAYDTARAALEPKP